MHSYDWLTDENDVTCNRDPNVKQVFAKLTSENYFSWLRLTFKENEPIRHVDIQFHTYDSVLPCKNQKLSLVNNNTIDVWCALSVLIQEVNIIGEGVRTLCSVYVSGGRNVALKQPTHQTSTFSDFSLSQSFHAVDGNTDSVFQHGSCSHTAPGDTSPTWTVEFDELYVVNKFVIYNRVPQPSYFYDEEEWNYRDRLKNFIISVYNGGTMILYYTDVGATAQNNYTVKRFISESATEVTITGTYNDGHGKILTLCEVEIYGDCPEGKRGLDCSQTCSKVNNFCNSICFGASDPPSCTNDCTAGRWGINCGNNCTGQCWSSNCDSKTGLCLSGCHGYMNPPYCTRVCPHDHWGLNCNQTCSSNCPGSTCDRLTGQCLSVCSPGFYGPTCSKECEPGRWGVNCVQRCNSGCYHNNCSKVNGHCFEGCNGFSDPPLCTFACEQSLYGLNCSGNCSDNCENHICKSDNGVCLKCLPGFQGTYCENACSNSTWGVDCTEVCSPQCDKHMCDSKTGSCFYSSGSTSNDFGKWIGIGIAIGVVLIAVCVSVVCFIKRRKPKRSSGWPGQEPVIHLKMKDDDMKLIFFVSTFLFAIFISYNNTAANTCSIGWFGDFCQYKCHCQTKPCLSNGTCDGTTCESGWFGLNCQYVNLIKHEDIWLSDENDSTCNKENSTKVSTYLTAESYFTWMRLTFKDKVPIKGVSIEFNTSTSVVDCTDQRLYMVDNRTLDVWCTLNVAIQQINLLGEGVATLCSIYVSGGQNVALKQPTNQTSTFHNEQGDTPSSISSNAVDGNIEGTFQRQSCTHTGKDDNSPTWTVHFNNSFVINKFVLYNRGNTENSVGDDIIYKDRLKHFILRAFDENSTELFNYNDKEETKNIYTVNQFISDRVATVQITATTKHDGVFVTLCEVEIFGDCPDGWRGLKCEHECNKEENLCNRVCFGASDPPNCNKNCTVGLWGLNCANNCTERCKGYNCDNINGFCRSGCNGYNDPPYCSQVCQDNKWGLNCSQTCSSNCRNSTCDRHTGNCVSGCLPGFIVPQCDKACDLGHWGVNCNNSCNTGCFHGNCSNVNGDCLQGCQGFSDPPKCTLVSALQKEDDKTNIALIVGPIAAGVLLMCLIVFGIIIWRRRRSAARKQYTESETNNSYEHTLEQLSSKEERNEIDNDKYNSEAKQTLSGLDGGYYNTVEAKQDTSIHVSDFNEFMKSHQRQFFNEQFNKIPAPVDVSMEVANEENNKNKNRYKNICTYDHSRVNLNINPGKNESNYINASYIKGFNNKVEFIASQGPNPTILNDFVRMLWEQKVKTVVMLTNLIEEGKMKCEKYWPDEGKISFGDIKMRLVTTFTYSDYTIRKLELIKKNEDTHHFVHYQFHAWPDKGVPVSTWSLVDFAFTVSDNHSSGITVVHCSAGVGRTGTFIALLNILAQAKATGKMNFLQTVTKLRQDRVFMVQTSAQYEFLHKVTQVSLLCIDTPVDEVTSGPHSGHKMRRDNRIEVEFKKLCAACSVVNTEEKIDEDDGDNVYQNTQKMSGEDKNRFPSISPSVRFRPYLNTSNDITDDYINAVIIQGVKQRDQYFLTQLPMSKTVDDFWRLVTQYKINVIVAFEVDDINKDKTVAKFLPSQSEKKIETSLFKLSCDTQRSKSTLLWDEQRLTVTCKHEIHSERHEVISLHVSFKDLSATKWLSLVKHVKKCYAPDGKVVYLCKNGAEFSGLANALSMMLERMDSEIKVSVPLVVGSMKLIRPEVIVSVEQYKLIYEVLSLCNETSNQYTNVGDRFLKETL